MRATTLRIENFRGIKRLGLDLDELTVLIGENDTGKAAVLDAPRTPSSAHPTPGCSRRTIAGREGT